MAEMGGSQLVPGYTSPWDRSRQGPYMGPMPVITVPQLSDEVMAIISGTYVPDQQEIERQMVESGVITQEELDAAKEAYVGTEVEEQEFSSIKDLLEGSTEEVEEYGEDLMTSYQDLVDEGKIVTGIPDYVAEEEPAETFELPTWEEVWEKAKDAVAKNPQAAGDILREILESMGVPVPEDINDILQGGYGVVWDERTGGIFNENGIIFVPGVPVGGEPTSVEVGTIGEILAGEGGEVAERTIQTILSEVGVVFDEEGKPVDYDPTAILDVIVGTQAEDVPPSVLEAILTGSATIGAVDWLKDLISGGAEQPTPTPTPPISGTADSGEEEPEPAGLAFGHEWSDEPIAGPETSPQVLDLNNYVTKDPDLTDGGEITRTGGESILSFGPEFVFDTDTEVINGTLDDPTQEVLSGSGSDGGAGGGAGGGEGAFDPLIKTIPFNPPAVPGMLRTPFIDSVAELNKIIARNSNRGGMLV